MSSSGAGDTVHSLPVSETSRWWGLRFRISERVASSLFLIPSMYIVAALLLAEFVPQVEDGESLALGLDQETARTMLAAIAGGMIAFTGLVVSIAIVVVQFGASQYTPRLVNLFRKDLRVKHSLGVFIAPAIFALVAMRQIGESGAEGVSSAMIVLSVVLLVAAVLSFFLLVAGLLDLLRPRLVIDTLVRQAGAAIRDVYPDNASGTTDGQAWRDLPVAESVVHHGSPAVLSALDRGRLVRAAKSSDVVVEVVVGVGSYIPTGAPLFVVRGGQGKTDLQEMRRSMMFSVERTITQDPMFAIRTLVDLALRALSPAVNDPTTAVQALDGLESILRDLAYRELDGRGVIGDAAGAVRLVYPNPDWADLLELAVTEIRHYGAGSPQIARRLRALLDALEAHSPQSCQAAIDDQRERLARTIAAAYTDHVERAHAMAPDRLGLGG